MAKFYFSYGTDNGFPFKEGHTEIEAQDKESAIELFNSVHPCRTDNIINCAFIYDEDEWKEMEGKYPSMEVCHEKLKAD